MNTHSSRPLRPLVPKLEFRPARTRELATLSRLAPEVELFDRTLVADGRLRVLLRDQQPIGAIGWL